MRVQPPLRPSLGCKFLREKMAQAFPKWDWLPVGRAPPPPSISGIIQLAGDHKLNLGVQSLAGKILISKGLPIVFSALNSHNGTDALSARRHGLDDDRKIAGLCARSDVTCACGKRKLRSRFCPSLELPHSSQERA